MGHQHKAIYHKEKEKEVAAIRYLEGVRLSRYCSTDNQVPSTDGPKAEVPDSDPDSNKTPDDFDKNFPKDEAAPKDNSDAAVPKGVSDTVSKRTPDDSEKVVVDNLVMTLPS